MLPIEKLRLIEALLKKKGINMPDAEIISRRPEKGTHPLSFAQQRQWFFHQLEPDSPAYNVAGALRIRGKLNIGALGRTFDEVVRRHEVLRTTFSTVGGLPVQTVAPSHMVNMSIVELMALPEEAREARVRRIITEESRQPFDLSRGPVLRVTLLRLGEDEHVLLVTMHHIVSDGWSVGVLVREVVRLYEGFSGNVPSPLPELPIQYADYARWQHEWLTGSVLDEQLAYWRKHIEGAPPIFDIPTDKPRPAVPRFHGATSYLKLSHDLTRAVHELGRREGVTLFMMLLSAFKTLLYRYTNQPHIVVGTPIAGRDRAELEQIIGFFVNSLVLHTELAGELTFRELLARVREVTLGAYAHQALPFDKLVEELRPPRVAGFQPLFQIFFILNNAPSEPFKLPGLEVVPIEIDTGAAKFDIEFVAVEIDGVLTISINYNTDLFNELTVAGILRHYQQLLKEVVTNPENRLLDFTFGSGTAGQGSDAAAASFDNTDQFAFEL